MVTSQRQLPLDHRSQEQVSNSSKVSYIITKFVQEWTKNMVSMVITGTFGDLPRDLALTSKSWFANLDKLSYRQTFWPSTKKIGPTIWPLEC